MPRHAENVEEALNKKGGLTHSQFANYDDRITDALVDRVYYWSNTRKLNENYRACRGVHEELVCKIQQDEVILERDPSRAHEKILGLPGIANFYKGLGSNGEKVQFERHLRKYINLYLPDCPFEVDTTNRYTISTTEACTKARKPIKKGEAIKYLTGTHVEMTGKEEKELSSRTDFSVVLSGRSKRLSLFLGPARFANHDCDPNARLNTTRPHSIHVVACKDIAIGDEITVTYGKDYFGIDNYECLCATCEHLTRNGWDPLGPLLPGSGNTEEKPVRRPKAEPQRHVSLLGKRRCGGRLSYTNAHAENATMCAKDEPHNSFSDGDAMGGAEASKRIRFPQGLTVGLSMDTSKSRLSAIKKDRSAPSIRNVVTPPPPSSPKGERDRLRKRPPPQGQTTASSNSSSPSPTRDISSQTSQTLSLTTVDSFSAGNIAFSICEMFTSPIDHMAEQEAVVVGTNHKTPVGLEKDEATEDVDQLTCGQTALAQPTQIPSPSEEASHAEEKRGPVRTPGDYTLFKTPLSTPYHCWIECHNCEEYFVQADASQTRIACPRCERHSKLYVYLWPKTDKNEKLDRTVHLSIGGRRVKSSGEEGH